MEAHIQKWGNSLAVRIPQAFAAEVGLAQNSLVELTLQDGQLVITPVRTRRYRLQDLLSGITDENRHEEVDTGEPRGNEVW